MPLSEVLLFIIKILNEINGINFSQLYIFLYNHVMCCGLCCDSLNLYIYTLILLDALYQIKYNMISVYYLNITFFDYSFFANCF